MLILITGGGGYVGSKLVPVLLNDGHRVLVYDTFWFGDKLPRGNHALMGDERPRRDNHPYLINSNLTKWRADIRDEYSFAKALAYFPEPFDAVIHLACLSNDPSSELDRELTKSINLDAFEGLVMAAEHAGVKRFINCSTSSVYGISDAPDVREDHPHVPLTLYNTYKSQCELLLNAYRGPMEWVTIRPSTICGYAPRQRLDLAVNILTNLAVNKNKITVYGGKQMRPNLHINDMVDCYRLLLRAPAEKVVGQTFNVGAGNKSIEDLALLVRDVVYTRTGIRPEIETKPIHDERSYQVNSDKIAQVLAFRPRHSVGDAVADLCNAFSQGLIPEPLERSEYYNVKRMKEVFADLYRDAPTSVFKPDEGILSEVDLQRGARP